MERYKAAIPSYDQALKIRPDYPAALVNRAISGNRLLRDGFGPSGGPLGCNSNVPLAPLSMWQVTQFFRLAGKGVSLLASKIVPLKPTTTSGAWRKPAELA